MKEAITIPKSKLKFIIEVSKSDTEVKVSATRFIEVPHNENMATNAQLAKYDSIEVNKQYHNCNALVKGVLAYLEECLEIEDSRDTPKHFILKKQQGSFGR